MLINGVEFEVDLLDADEAERIEQIYAKMENEYTSRYDELKTMKLSESIRAQCDIVFRLFDGMFGCGAHEKIFGAKTNLGTCLDTMVQFAIDLANARAAAIDNMTGGWSAAIKALKKEEHDEPAV